MPFLALHRTLYLAAVPVQLVERHLRVDVVVEVLHLEHLHKTDARALAINIYGGFIFVRK